MVTSNLAPTELVGPSRGSMRTTPPSAIQPSGTRTVNACSLGSTRERNHVPGWGSPVPHGSYPSECFSETTETLLPQLPDSRCHSGNIVGRKREKETKQTNVESVTYRF